MTPAALIPRSVLFGNPRRLAPQVSPDGTRVAYLAPLDGVLNVWITRLGSTDAEAVTADRHRGVRMFRWAHDNRHLLWQQDVHGDENWHLYSLNLDRGRSHDRTPFDGVQARLLHAHRRQPDAVLVGINRDNPQLHDLYRLDLAAGQLDRVAANPGFATWLIDPGARVRGGIAMAPDGGLVVSVDRCDRRVPPRTFRIEPEDAGSTQPVALTADGTRLLLLSSRNANTARLVSLDLRTGKEQVLFEDPRHDVEEALVHPDTHEPQVVSVRADRVHHTALDPSVSGDIKRLVRLQDGDLSVLSRDDADRRWVVGFTVDDGPVSFHLYDRLHSTTQALFTHNSELRGYRLAKTEPFAFTARDGLRIHGYLTFPPGLGRSALPVVLDVHGGPWARDCWGFDPEVQWLANRGYLCVQVNFRGSTGYGKDFLNAGDKQWGGAMQADLVDAVEWVCRQGFADRRRLAVFGTSYGGYAALMGATDTPSLFRCAVDLMGPSNLVTLLESIPPYWRPMTAMLHRRVGDPRTERALLWSRSPLAHVDRMRIPVLVAQGVNDPRVKCSEAEAIISALRNGGIPHEYLLFDDEGHGLVKPENRLRFYAAAERFLARHLGGRHEE